MRLDYCGIRCCTGASVISWYSILFSYNHFARGHTDEICAREIVKTHDDSPETSFLVLCFRSGVFVSLCAEPRRGQLVLVIRRVRELPINARRRTCPLTPRALQVPGGATGALLALA